MPSRSNQSPESEQWLRRASKTRSAKCVTLEAPFAGLLKGTVLFIGTPALLRSYIEAIPHGQSRSLQRLRRDIARANKCQAMCPVSTAIFLRLIAEVAWDELRRGVSPSQVAPFWRVIEPATPIARRLRVPQEWLRQQRQLEQDPVAS